jgi:hypothetical protein
VRRREFLRRGAVALGGMSLGTRLLHAGSCAEAPDALQERTLTELDEFVAWLKAHRVPGFIGEVGWPDRGDGASNRWNALAERWYARADAAGLWVSNWAAGEWWGDYPLATYRAARPQGVIDTAGSQAAVVEAHPSARGYRRGVALAGGAFGFPSDPPTSRYSNRAPGRLDVDYHYDGPASLRFLARRGVDLLRVEFRWERLQPVLGAPLDAAELGRLRSVVRAARGARLAVVLDMHNFGAYYLHDGDRGVRRAVGSPELPAQRLADAWERIAHAFRREPGILGYGLMNEPVGMPGGARAWEAASRDALAAVRGSGERRLVSVAGYAWSGLHTWTARHRDPWVDDPAVVFEAHHYWDRDHDSVYEEPYERQARRM